MDYAQATLPHDSTGLAPIQLEMGYLPRTSFDWNRLEELRIVREKLSREEAQQYVKRLEEVWKVARTNCSSRNMSFLLPFSPRLRILVTWLPIDSVLLTEPS